MDQETLSPDELVYHQHLTAQVKAAQAAWHSWSVHLAAKYRLGEGDGITEQGDVVRGEPAEPVSSAEAADQV
jgi:hypothetical protein